MNSNSVVTSMYATDVSHSLFRDESKIMPPGNDLIAGLEPIPGVNKPFLYIGNAAFKTLFSFSSSSFFHP